MSQFLEMFQQMGPRGFSDVVGQVAPYFASIDPVVSELRPNYCEVSLSKQKKVENHLGTVHAIAMCNAAELAAGMATDVSIPAGWRWIPQGMTVEYVAKAKTDLNVVCDAHGVDFSLPGPVVVHVDAFDAEGNKVFWADITMNVKSA